MDNLETEDVKVTIKITGKATTAILYKKGSVVRTAEAKCCPTDTFNFAVGLKLALSRLLGSFTPYLKYRGTKHGIIGEKTNIKDVRGRTLCVGDVVDFYTYSNEITTGVVVRRRKKDFISGYATVLWVNGVYGSCRIIKQRSYSEINDGEIIDDVTYIKESR